MGISPDSLNYGFSDASKKQVIHESINELKKEEVNVYKPII